MSAILAPLVIYIFTALNYNATDSLDGGHLRMAHSLKECAAWKAAYDKSMIAANNELAPAFKIRWVASCDVRVPHLGDSGE